MVQARGRRVRRQLPMHEQQQQQNSYPHVSLCLLRRNEEEEEEETKEDLHPSKGHVCIAVDHVRIMRPLVGPLAHVWITSHRLDHQCSIQWT